MIVERTGDLFTSDCPALGHGVNTLGSMGAGIAVEFRRRWPAMYDAYRAECRSGRLQPGGVFVWQADDRLIVNLATQRGVGRGAARLEWVRAAAKQVAQLSLDGLALPRIGAGMGGLRWADVRAILDHELAPLTYVELWSR
jgi:O-acetyl-ADP-ribose deacetylase (regulator of RNase III)